MNEIRIIPYADWLKYVKESCRKGKHCNEFRELQHSAPLLSGTGYGVYARNELAKLETGLLKVIVNDFQHSVNRSFEEADIFIFENGIRELKKSIKECLFFDNEGYPEEIKKSLKEGIRLNLASFLDEFAKYIKKIMEYENGPFMDDFIYIYRKANIGKFVQEYTAYE